MTEPDKDYATKMLDEIRAVKEKYGLPKGILLVPDRLEISLKRNSYDNFHLSYKEYFEYLPNEILDLVIPNSINLLVQMGIPRERIERNPNNCVRMELDGNSLLAIGVILSELAIQKRFSEEELEQLLKSNKKVTKSLTELSDLEFEWNNEISQKFSNNLVQAGTVIQRNPSLLLELENIPKKYLQSSEKVRAILEKKGAETNTQ